MCVYIYSCSVVFLSYSVIMEYSDKLRKQHPSLWEASGKSVFLSHMENGTLSVDKFRNYVIQRHILDRQFKKFVGVLASKFPQHFEHATSKSASEIFGKVISDVSNEHKFQRFAKDLKITDSEIHPTLVTKGISDYLMMIAYNQGYKEALVVAVALKGIYDINKHIIGKGGDNPLFKEALQKRDPSQTDFLEWAEATLNVVMRNVSEVSPKHASVLKYILQWEVTFLESSWQPDKWKWPVQ